MKPSKTTYFPAEWEVQSAIQLTWPTDRTDWKECLDEAVDCYVQLAKAILKDALLILVCPNQSAVRSFFTEEEWNKIILCEMDYDDTWARDHGGISIYREGIPTVLDFRFDAWGGKFESSLDNLITQNLFKQNVFVSDVQLENHHDFVLEGGALESNGAGVLLTTSQCLLNDNRNGGMKKSEVEEELIERLGVKKVLWLTHGAIEGDDTDSHVDTLARFVNENTIAYVRCSDPSNEHYEELKKLELELNELRNLENLPFNLIPLPFPSPQFHPIDGHLLPATYANFLIMNNQVLLPVYGVREDAEAIEVLRKCFPQKNIVAVDCSVLIRQNGSLHCVTMQYPKGYVSSKRL